MSAKQGSDWKWLRGELIRATASAGAKAALAREFGVTRSAVSQWLSGASVPTADTALRLLNWVKCKQDEETVKQASPGDAQTPPGRQTRKRKIKDNEKPRSSPPKT